MQLSLGTEVQDVNIVRILGRVSLPRVSLVSAGPQTLSFAIMFTTSFFFFLTETLM